MEPEGSLPHSQVSGCAFRKKRRFYGELLAPSTTSKLEDHPLSAVHDSLFNLFAVTLHIVGRSSIRNLRTRHALLTGTRYTVPTVLLILSIYNSFREVYI